MGYQKQFGNIKADFMIEVISFYRSSLCYNAPQEDIKSLFTQPNATLSQSFHGDCIMWARTKV